MTSNWQDRITVDADVLVGKPVVKGTRLAVEFIVELLAEGWSEAKLLKQYSGLTRADIRACLAYAGACLAGKHGSVAIAGPSSQEKRVTLAEFFHLLDGLDWPDEDFARDLEAIQASQPIAEFPEWPS